jgi:uncharacterized protein YbgA (DUF1722 family)/uncharacterized protein YbbK (DUF523 family)
VSDAPLRIGISRCLLGDEVRWDGGHKHDGFLTGTLGRYVEWVPFCPEVESGLPVPRETLRLVRADTPHEDDVPVAGIPVRLVFPKSGGDWTRQMATWAARRARELADLDLHGAILKKDSPSCGVERVRVYGAHGMAERVGRGLFTEALLQRLQHLPVEDEGRLNDPRLRDNFVERLFAYRRLRALFAARWTVGDLVRFHTAHKLAVMAHAPAAYQALGRLVATAKARPRGELRDAYESAFMTALRVVATPARQANVLHHAMGHLKGRLDAGDTRELLELIDEHRRGLVPLVVPLTLLRHHVRRHAVAYLTGQTWLEPHPRELALRNHV